MLQSRFWINKYVFIPIVSSTIPPFLFKSANALKSANQEEHCTAAAAIVVNSISIEETIVKRNPIDTKKNVDLSLSLSSPS